MGGGYVGTITADLHLPHSHSLKEKRRETRRVIARVRSTFHCAVAEVDHLDVWQRTQISAAVVGNEARQLSAIIDAITATLETDPEMELLGAVTDIRPIATGDDEWDGQ